MKTVSIIIPAYNEEASIGLLMDKIRTVDTESLGFQKEIIIVDDGSTDSTAEIVKNLLDENIQFLQQENQGKGKAVQNGIAKATGEFVLVQDADLEYEPKDYIPLLKNITGSNSVVYGSRTMGQYYKYNRKFPFPGRHNTQAFGPWIAGVVLTFWVFLLYGRWITDTLTGYKVYPRDLICKLNIVTCGFETDHEITSKLLKKKIGIKEVPIEYYPRTIEEGKKIRFSDGIKAILTFLKFRWFS